MTVDELTLLAEMREDVPSDTRYPAAYRALMAEIAGAPPASTRRAHRRVRRPVLLSGVLAGAVATGAVVVAVNSGEHHAPPVAHQTTSTTAPPLRLVAVTSPTALAANAVSVARRAPVPSAAQWVYVKLESTISHAPPSGAMVQVPGSHRTTETWTRVDMRYIASVKNGKTVVTSTNGGMGNPIGWPAINYSYLNSLPTDPDALLTLIRHTMSVPENGNISHPTDQDVFTSVLALMENYTVLPARLNAALYGVLAKLKVVHLERVKDIAGRKVLSLYRIEDGLKESILIDPKTYAYAGQKRIMVADHTSRGLDTTLHLRKGQLLDDEAIIVSKIVNSAGARS